METSSTGARLSRKKREEHSMADVWTNLIVATLTLMAWSMLYRENVFYSFIESLLVGFAMGYTMYITVSTLQKTLYTPLMGGKVLLLVPALLGFLLFAAFSQQYRFLARWGAAAITGGGLGFAVSRSVPVQILGQVKQFYLDFATAGSMDIVNWLIVSITAISTIVYFTFTREHKGALGAAARIGRLSMMVAFGATFGSTIGGDLFYVIERALFLSQQPQVFLLIPAIILVAWDAQRRRKK